MSMWLSRCLVVSLVILLSACSSTTRDYKGVYEESEKSTELDVPPDLDKPITSNEVNLTELGQSVKSYSSYEQNLKDKPKSAFEYKYKGMEFKRDGTLFWLEVSAPAEDVWQDLRAYFGRLGFDIVTDNPAVGFMQTDWLENRVDLPTGWIGDILGTLFSVDIMDRYRVRLEWDHTQRISRVFIMHQGLREVVQGQDDNLSVVQTKWTVRPSDPELEVEMIMRFMAYRGLEETIAEQQIAGVKTQERVKFIEQDDAMRLELADSYERSWRHMTIAIDRLGYLVEDKNRSAGVFYIQLPETFEVKSEGFFGSIFSGGFDKPKHDKYLIVLEDKGTQTIVTVKPNGDVTEDFKTVARKILKDIQANIL